MAIFARFNGLITMKFTPAIMILTLGMIAGNSAHAEKYCKSVDESGNASYTLAPETGCNKNKFKTVAVRQFSAPATTPTTNTTEANKTTESKAEPAVVTPAPVRVPAPDGNTPAAE